MRNYWRQRQMRTCLELWIPVCSGWILLVLINLLFINFNAGKIWEQEMNLAWRLPFCTTTTFTKFLGDLKGTRWSQRYWLIRNPSFKIDVKNQHFTIMRKNIRRLFSAAKIFSLHTWRVNKGVLNLPERKF